MTRPRPATKRSMSCSRARGRSIDGEDVAVTEGDYLRVDPASTRQVLAGPEGLRFIVVGAKPQPEYDGRESL